MPKLNNKGIGFIPILVLSLLVGVSALVGYRFYSNQDVLQATVIEEPNIEFLYSDNNLTVIEIRIFGAGAEAFVKNLPKENRVLQTSSSGEQETTYREFRRVTNGDFVTSFRILNDRVEKISFLDLKFPKNVKASNLSPWEINKNSNGLTKSSSPSNSEIKVTLGYSQVGDIFQTGKITLTMRLTDNQIITFRNDLRKSGLEVQDYCMVANCPKPRIVRPTIIVDGALATVDVPVTAMVKSISYKGNPLIKLEQMPKFKFENNLDGWDLGLSDEDKKFSLVRKNQQSNVGVYLKSFNSQTGQQNLEILINGIGDETASLIRGIRVAGIGRVDIKGDMESTIRVRSAVSYRAGQGTMIIAAPRNTKAILFTSSGLDNLPTPGPIKIDFNPLPSGWKVNKEGTGIEKLTMENPAEMRVTSVGISGTTDTNFNFIVIAGKSDMEKILATLKDDGISVTRCTSEPSCFYPVQKITMVACGDYSTVGCRFSVRVPRDATMIYFNYKQGNSVSADIKTLPRGWKSTENGIGLNKF